MSRQGEMKEKYDKIRELQEQRDRREREAQSQSDELDAILDASREAHGETPLVSASRLSGPGFGGLARKSATSPEDAYSANFEKSRFASPEAFSRSRGNPTAIPDGSISALQQRTMTSGAGAANGQVAGESDAAASRLTEGTVTMTVKALAPSKDEVTQVVRRRAAQMGNRPRREPPPIAPQNLAGPPIADGPAIKLPEAPPKALPQLPTSGDDTPIVPANKRVVFQRPAATPASSRMVTNRPANYGTLPHPGSASHVTHDTVPSRPRAKQIVWRGADDSGVTKPDDTSPGIGDTTSPGPGDSTSPGLGDSTSPGGPERDTSPGMGDTPIPFEQTSPGTFPGVDRTIREQPAQAAIAAATIERATAAHATIDPTTMDDAAMEQRTVEQRIIQRDEADPFWRDDVDYEPLPVVPIAARSPDVPAAAAAPTPKPAAPESTENDARYKRVREIDALIARFAADVEVKVGQGRENTFLRKRSEIVPPEHRSSSTPVDIDDEFSDERTQPRHRNIEVRRENTEIIPRRLPPRKRK